MGNTGSTTAQRHRDAFIAGLRLLADELERYPDLPVPPPSYAGRPPHLQVNLLLAPDARDRFVAATRILPSRPEVTAGAVMLTHRFGAPHDPALGLTYGLCVSPSALVDSPTPDEIARAAEAFVAGVTGVPA